MTGKQIFQLGTDSAAVHTCIPMCFEPTVPQIKWCDGWIAEFWYYFTDIHDQSIYNPQYYIAFDILTKKPVKMERLEKNVCCLGFASELSENEFYNRQNCYLEKCEELIKTECPTEEGISSLQKLWLESLPEKLRIILSEKSNSYYSCYSQSTDSTYHPKNMMEVLKLEMLKATEKGDVNEIRKIQNEMSKLLK